MKHNKVILALGLSTLLIVSASGCKAKTEDMGAQETRAPEVVTTEANEMVTTGSDADAIATPKEDGKSWPKEFADWSVPTLSAGVVAFSDNKSVEGNTITQGVNVTVNVKEVKKEDFEGYVKDIEDQGFVKGSDSLEGVMLFYTKAIDGGEIKLTLTYASDALTVIANNSAVAAEKASGAAGASSDSATGAWPEAASGVPEFKGGTFLETVDLTGGFYGVTYTGVSEKALEAYRQTLKDSGFTPQDNDDTEGYMRIDGKNIYSVGFVVEGDKVQIMIMCAKQ